VTETRAGICHHGGLRRQCEPCDLAEELAAIRHMAAEAGFSDKESQADPSQVIRVLVETVADLEGRLMARAPDPSLTALEALCRTGISEAAAMDSPARGFALDAFHRILDAIKNGGAV
jgi:hypothetical protein